LHPGDDARAGKIGMSDTASDLGVAILHPLTGEVWSPIPIIVEDVAVGTRGTVKRARRADPLDAIDGVTAGMKMAAAIYRQASEHVDAGRGMGPLPFARDMANMGHGAGLLAQERAITAADWLRRGSASFGSAWAEWLVCSVVVDGVPLTVCAVKLRRRRHTARAHLLAALERLAVAYGVS
jgi:hypothetical protein